MKIYYSTLSISAILTIAWGIWILAAMLKGAYPTYLAFALPVLGLLFLGVDYFIRKSKLDIKTKVFIQANILIFIVIVEYYLSKG